MSTNELCDECAKARSIELENEMKRRMKEEEPPQL
jgi:hypothetical protein